MAQSDVDALLGDIRQWAIELGFSEMGVSGIDLSSAEQALLDWLAEGYHGDMHYMQKHGTKRARPAELVPGTLSVLSFRINYLPKSVPEDWLAKSWQELEAKGLGVVSWYARGRDYHKIARARLEQLAQRIENRLGPIGHRVFTDSAPVLEVELAVRAGLGWRGKHTLCLSREAGSMFFLGEIFVDIALPESVAKSAHCGSCQRCIDICPTKAIIAPYKLDARRCISYLTIEHEGAIPVELRAPMGNRIYGCDDCQTICPWNKFAGRTMLSDFDSRGLENRDLAEMLDWSEETFLAKTEGSAIRRIGHRRWLRNLAVASGNALAGELSELARERLCSALQDRLEHADPMVREHVAWALSQVAASKAQ